VGRENDYGKPRVVNHGVNDMVNRVVNHRVNHKSPCRVRYEQSHPIVSVRINSELYDELKELGRTTGKSFADFLKDGAGITKTQVKEDLSPECMFCNEQCDWGDYFVICKSCFRENREGLPDLIDSYFSH